MVTKINYKVLWYLIPLLVTSFIVGIIVLNKVTENIFNEYPPLKNYEFINTTVIGFDKYKGTTLVVLKDSAKISLSAFNWDLKPSPLYYHLEKGDLLLCEPYTNTLFLIKKNKSVKEFEIQYLE